MTPPDYVQVARTYLVAFNRCLEPQQRPGGTFEMPLMPGIVCVAFSIELSLKGLLLQQGKPTRSHDLRRLFEGIDRPIQEAMIDACHLPEDLFQRRLEQARQGFVRWRYFFEHATLGVDIPFLQNFAAAALSIAREQVEP
jgi:hypothetical protein